MLPHEILAGVLWCLDESDIASFTSAFPALLGDRILRNIAVCRGNLIRAWEMLPNARILDKLSQEQLRMVSCRAAVSGDFRALRVLSRYGIDEGWLQPAFKRAYRLGLDEISAFLVKHWPSLGSTELVPSNPRILEVDKLHDAISKNRESEFDVMLNAGFDVDAFVLEGVEFKHLDNPRDFTILAYAANKGKASFVRKLLLAGADPNKVFVGTRKALDHVPVRNFLGDFEDPLDSDVELDDISLEQLTEIINANDDVELDFWDVGYDFVDILVSHQGTEKTPLMLAARKGSVEVAKMLIDAGADLFAKTIDGKTVWDFADQMKHPSEMYLAGMTEAQKIEIYEAKRKEIVDFLASYLN